jgi:hypothetical protein
MRVVSSTDIRVPKEGKLMVINDQFGRLRGVVATSSDPQSVGSDLPDPGGRGLRLVRPRGREFHLTPPQGHRRRPSKGACTISHHY